MISYSLCIYNQMLKPNRSGGSEKQVQTSKLFVVL